MDTSTQTQTAAKQTKNADARSEESDVSKVHGVLKEFSTVMLSTFDKKGKHPRIHAQPMRVAKMDDDCTLYFITHVGSEKVEEAQKFDGHVTGQSWNRQISLNGTYEITQDRQKLAEVWSLAFNVWFPGGKDDPNACLMIFHPRDAEIWDSSGLKGLTYLVSSAKALVTKHPPEADSDQHAKVQLHRD